MVALNKDYLAKYNIDANQLAGVIPFSGHAITHFTIRKKKVSQSINRLLMNLRQSICKSSAAANVTDYG